MAKKQSADDTTLQLIQEVVKRKAAISNAERSNWQTNMSFSYLEGSSATVNLHVERDVGTLLKIISFIRARAYDYQDAVTAMEIDGAPPFKWQNFTVLEWTEDIKLRISKLQVDAQKKSLEAIEERLNKIISPELRQQMELEAIKKAMGL